MRNVCVTLVSVLALLTLVIAEPLPQEIDEAESKRGWASFDGGYGKRGWNAFEGGYGKRSAEDYGDDTPINEEDKRAWNSYQDGYGKRAWNSNFAGGMGKRAWNSQFAGGMGKRAWNSAFAGGMGKRAWNSGFSGGLGKRSPYPIGANRSSEDEKVLEKRSWSDRGMRGTFGKRSWSNDGMRGAFGKRSWSDDGMRGAFGKRSWSDDGMRGAFGKRSWSDDGMRGAFGKRNWSNDGMRGAFGKRSWSDDGMRGAFGKRGKRDWQQLGVGWGRRKRSQTYFDCDSLKRLVLKEHEMVIAPRNSLKNCKKLKQLVLNEHIKRSQTQEAYLLSQMIQASNGKKRTRTNNWTQLRGMWGKRSGPPPARNLEPGQDDEEMAERRQHIYQKTDTKSALHLEPSEGDDLQLTEMGEDVLQ